MPPPASIEADAADPLRADSERSEFEISVEDSRDVGALSQTICLTALNYGLGTCIQDQGVMYPEVLREFCNIPDTKQIIIAIAMGYPDWDFPANQLETPRESVDRITRWCGFDG